MTHIRSLLRGCLTMQQLKSSAFMLWFGVALAGWPVNAQDQPPAVAFQHGVLVPAFEPRTDGRGSLDRFDPTVVPFSGWRFIGPAGEDQAWRRRSLQHSFHHGGQRNEAIGESPVQFVGVWSYPEGQGVEISGFRPGNRSTQRLGLSVDWIDNRRWPANCEIRRWLIADVNQLPDELRLNALCSAGETRTVARFTLGQPMPVTSANARIKYFGEVRADGPARNALADEPGFFFEAQQPFNLELQYEVSGEDGVHWPEFYARDGSRIQPESHEVLQGPDEHYVCLLPMDRFRYATLQFKPLEEVPVESVDLTALHQSANAAGQPRRIEVPRSARFGPPQTLSLLRLAAGETCMVNLDEAQGIEIPTPLPSEDDLDRYAHQTQADLIWRLTSDVHTLHMLASPIYEMPREHWNRSPHDCVTHALERCKIYRDRVPAPTSVGKVYLTTTSDGSMVLFRIKRFVPWNGRTKARAHLDLEIRRIAD